ncbi:MAG: DUF3037 domain-containing protein [Chloroflexi bacterium]|nr:DUF3037 domain-containing protein [Chloroflexota bacterium]
MNEHLTPYEAIFLQYRPLPFSGECLNVGVLVLGLETGQFALRVLDRRRRISEAYPGLEARGLLRHLSAIRSRANRLNRDRLQTHMLRRNETATDVALEIAPRIGPALAWSAAFGGLCADIAKRADELHAEFIHRWDSGRQRERVNSEQLWGWVEDRPAVKEVLPLMQRMKIASDAREHIFPAGWQNGTAQVADAISFDYARPEQIVQRAELWSGRLSELRRGREFQFTAIVTETPEGQDGKEAYEQALSILGNNAMVRRILPYSSADELAKMILRDTGSH